MSAVLRWPVSLALLLYQSVVLALAQIWANKVRAFLTTLGILIGVAAVSAVIALITGMKERVIAEFEKFGANKLMISPQWRKQDFRDGGRWNVVFKPGDFDQMLRFCPSVENYTRDVGLGEPMAVGPSRKRDERINLGGFDPSWHDIQPRGVSIGRPINDIDSLQHRRVAVIDERLREQLKFDVDPTGEIIDVEYFGRFLIVGMLEQPTFLLGRANRDGSVWIPFSSATYKLFFYPTWYGVTATAKSRELVEDAQSEIEFYLRQKRRLKPGEENNFSIATAQKNIDQINEVASMVTAIAGGIVAISLLVGGVGIMNIMLVSVSERTREIGLRKAVGATPAAICVQFLVEATVLCLVGGALGLIAGQGITSFVSSFIPASGFTVDRETIMPGLTSHIVLPTSAIVLAFGFSASVGLTFGMFPAIKAAMFDPIEALRHE